MPDQFRTRGGVGIYPVEDFQAQREEADLRTQALELNRLRVTDAMEERRAKLEQAKAAQEEDAFLSDAVKRHTVNGKPDFDAVVTETYQRYPGRALLLEKAISDHRSKLVTARKQELDADEQSMKNDVAIMARMGDPEAFTVLRPKLSPEAQQLVGDAFDPIYTPKRLTELSQAGAKNATTTAEMRLALQNGDIRNHFLTALEHAATPEDVQDISDGLDEMYGPRQASIFKQSIGDPLTPEGKSRIAAMRQAGVKPENAPNVGTFEDYVTRQYGANPTPKQIEDARRKWSDLGRESPQTGGGAGGGGQVSGKLPPQARAVYDRVLIGVPGTRVGPIKQGMNNLAANGASEGEIKSFLKLAAVETLGEANKTAMLGRIQTITALKDAESLLKSIPTGYVKGTWEDTMRALGTTSDPRLVELGTRMGTILANYMRSISGAAIADTEAARLQKLIPNYKNSLTVNLGQLKGFGDALKSFDNAFYQYKFGDNFDWMMSNAPASGGADAKKKTAEELLKLYGK